MDTILKAKLKRLTSHPDWEGIYAFVAFSKENWHKTEIKAEDQFNTIWNMAKKEGKIEGLDEFINNIEKISFND